METLSVESFSYSWLSNAKDDDPLDCLVDISSESFDFDVPNISHSFNYADANDLFSHGLIKPNAPPKPESSITSTVSAMPVSSSHHCHLLGRWRRSSGRMLGKCLRNLSIMCGKSSRVDDVDRIREWEVKRWNNVCYNSPRASSPLATSAPNYSRPDNMETSIYEAVLYCKRSIEK